MTALRKTLVVALFTTSAAVGFACSVSTNLNDCSCSISDNGVARDLTCGQTACINGRHYTCSADRLDPGDDEPCSPNDNSGEDRPDANASSNPPQPTPDAGANADAPPPPKVGMDAVIDGVSVHIADPSALVLPAAGVADTDHLSVTGSTTLNGAKVDITIFVPAKTISAPQEYDCSASDAATWVDVTEYQGDIFSPSREFSTIDPGLPCTITITSWDGNYVTGILEKTTIADKQNAHDTKTISATFAAVRGY